MSRFFGALLGALLFIAMVGPADPAHALSAPVEALVTDPWRAPLTDYGAGNRGIDYATVVGSAVSAAADGIVSFVGDVAGTRYVVVQHENGLRTTYGGVLDVLVSVGQTILQGGEVATAGTSLHFGLRDGDTYLDPTPYLEGRVILIPLDAPGTDGLTQQVSNEAVQWLLDRVAEDPGPAPVPGPRPLETRLTEGEEGSDWTDLAVGLAAELGGALASLFG